MAGIAELTSPLVSAGLLAVEKASVEPLDTLNKDHYILKLRG